MENRKLTSPLNIGTQGIFSRAARIKDKKYRDEIDWKIDMELNGATNFKRRALGLCGIVTVKSGEELTKLLMDTGIASTKEMVREIIPLLTGGPEFMYGPFCGYGYLTFTEVFNSVGEIGYEIRAHNIFISNW